MADRLLGYGYKPTITDNGSNKARYTFAPNTISRAWFALVSSGNLWNLTQAANQAVTASGGTEGGGYYFETGQDYDTLTWLATDRMHPMISSSISNQTSPTAMRAASANSDVIVSAYSDTNENTHWYSDPIVANAATPLVDFYGMAQARTIFHGNPGASTSGLYYVTGDCSGRGTQIILSDVTSVGWYQGVYYNDSSGSGGGIHATNCNFIGSANTAVRIGTSVAANVVKLTNCLIYGGNYGVYVGDPIIMYNCGVAYCTVGINNLSTASTYKNTWVIGSLASSACFQNITNATITYCATSDNTAGAGTGNIVIDLPGCDFWAENVGAYFPVSMDITTSSDLYNAGDYQAGQPTTDRYGNDITSTCPIGPHVGGTPFDAIFGDVSSESSASESSASESSLSESSESASSQSSASESSASESSASESSLSESSASATSESSASESSASESSASESSASESSTEAGGNSESSASESSASESTPSTSSSTSTSTSSTSSSISVSSSSSSTTGGSSSSSSESGVADETVNEYEDFLRDEGDQITIERKTVTVSDTGARAPSWTTVDTVFASVQPASSDDRAPFERRGLFVTHKIYIAEDPGITEGDRIGRYGTTKKYIVHGVKDVMDRSELWVLYCEEMKS